MASDYMMARIMKWGRQGEMKEVSQGEKCADRRKHGVGNFYVIYLFFSILFPFSFFKEQVAISSSIIKFQIPIFWRIL